MGASRKTRLSDTLVEAEGLCQRPLVFKGFIPAGRHPAAGVWSGRFATGEPRLPGPAINEARDGRKDSVPASLGASHDAGAAGSEEPLVTARHQKVAAKICHHYVFNAEAVNAVHAEDHAIGLVTIGIDPVQGVCNPAQGEL